MSYSKETKENIIRDYKEGILTVAQISFKYYVPRRTIYSFLEKTGATNRRRNSCSGHAGTIRLKRGEIESMLLLIADYGCTLPDDYKKYLPALEERLLDLADKTQW